MPDSKLSANAIATQRSQYIEALNEQYSAGYGKWLARQSEATQARIYTKSSQMGFGVPSIAPLNCQGPTRCPFFHACPIPEDPNKPGPNSLYPVNLPCVLEVQYVAQQVVSYMEQLNVQANDPVEMSLLNELALLDLLRNRAVLVLSGGDRNGQGRDMLLHEDIVLGYDKGGTPTMGVSTKPHPAVDVLDKHERRRMKILDKFNATRESRFKVYGHSLETHNKLNADMATLRGFLEQISKSGVTMSSEPEAPIYLDDREVEIIDERL